MKLHRAVVLVAMMLLSLGALALLVADAGGKSLIALAVVLVAAAIGGISFSWKRYYRR
jgi:uncharacterized membrane-anchored protein